MSEEQRNEETEVEAHGGGPRFDDVQKFSANDEPRDEADDVEAHLGKVSRPKHS